MPARSRFDTHRAHPGRWTITFSNPPINMFVPTTIVEYGALMTELKANPSITADCRRSRRSPQPSRLTVE